VSEKPFQEAFIRELKARDALIRDLKQWRAPPSPYLMDAMARVLRHLTEPGCRVIGPEDAESEQPASTEAIYAPR